MGKAKIAIWYLVKIPKQRVKAKNVKFVLKFLSDWTINNENSIKLKKKKLASKSVWVVVAWKSSMGILSRASNKNNWPLKPIFKQLKINVPVKSMKIKEANWSKLEKASVLDKIWKFAIMYSDKGGDTICLTILVGYG